MIIDANENRDIAVADVVGEYLLATMDDYVVVKVTGRAVEILCDITSDYKQHVTMGNGKRILYLRLGKDLYGCT